MIREFAYLYLSDHSTSEPLYSEPHHPHPTQDLFFNSLQYFNTDLSPIPMKKGDRMLKRLRTFERTCAPQIITTNSLQLAYVDRYQIFIYVNRQMYNKAIYKKRLAKKKYTV